MYNLKMAIIQQPKHAVVPYAENTLYSTNKYSRFCRCDVCPVASWVH